MISEALYSLIYVSSATKEMSLEEIVHLLTRARQRNQEYGVTGLLLYDRGNFMQYIEGPKANMEVIFKIIEENRQHKGLILLTQGPIEYRLFDDWSMAFLSKEFEGYVGSPSDRKLIDLVLSIDREDLRDAQIMLRGFWGKDYRSPS